MSEEKMRAKFERVVESKFGFDDNDFYFDKTDSTYNDPDLNDLWIVYQAALQVGNTPEQEQSDYTPAEDAAFDKGWEAGLARGRRYAKAIETAAIMRAEECVINTFNELQFKDSDTQLCVKAALGDAMVKLRALIPQDGRTQLAEFGWQVAHAILDARREGLLDGNEIHAIVTNLIGEKK